MKQQDVMILALAAFAAWVILGRGAKAAGPGLERGGQLVREWGGWRYYDNGIAIDPFGAYYREGVKVYDPIMGAV